MDKKYLNEIPYGVTVCKISKKENYEFYPFQKIEIFMEQT